MATARQLAQARASLHRRIVVCRRCPRLVEHRQRVAREKRPAFQDWEYWGRPITGFGDPQAPIVIIGLAPAAHGANRTGRIFTGDATARFLVSALHQADLASQSTSEHKGDGLELRGVYFTAALRCPPPNDRPTKRETDNCFPYLKEELTLLPSARVVLALGRIAFEAFLRYAGDVVGKPFRLPFRHGMRYDLHPKLPVLFASYHTSPRNTLTGRLSREEFLALLERVKQAASGEP